MRIIFVRHGHPDYKNDCLTGLGHLQAEAAAKRLCDEKIDKIYSSSCGRALQTAEHIASVHGLEVELLDFMREVKWGSVDDNPVIFDGHPWYTAYSLASEGKSLLNPDWDKTEPFCRNEVVSAVEKVGAGFDLLLENLGYKREGDFYRVGTSRYETVVIASHGGSSSAVLARLFNLPFPFICGTMGPDFTAVSVIRFSGDEGSLISPQIEIMNDARHILGVEGEAVFGR